MKVIDVLWSKKLSQIFRDPVKPSATFAPDYFQIIKHPMDLGTVRNKLRNAEYMTVKEFEVVRILCLYCVLPESSGCHPHLHAILLWY